MKTQEYTNSAQEQLKHPEAIEQAGQERREQLRENLERGQEQFNEGHLEAARHEALEKASSLEREKKAELTERITSPAERRRGPIGKAERDASYKATMQDIRTHMSPASRTFSKIIHNKTVDRVSEGLGNTVARPNAILSGAVFAFIISLITLLVARHYGYRLSGFETIGAFIAGWLLGIIYDFLKVMITGRR
jgi:hypothetical protein